MYLCIHYGKEQAIEKKKKTIKKKYFFQQEVVEENIDFRELQTMHVNYKSKTLLFIACNKPPITAHFEFFFSDPSSLKKVLTTDVEQVVNKLEQPAFHGFYEQEKKRAKRYLCNLNSKDDRYQYSIASKEDKKDIDYYKDILELLRTGNYVIHHFVPGYKKETGQAPTFQDKIQEGKRVEKFLNDPGNKVIFINISALEGSLKSMHAELFLTDVAKLIKKLIKKHIYVLLARKDPV